LAARLLGKRAGEPGLAGTGGTLDEQRLAGADPLAGAKTGELRLTEAAASA
jgi:hypothetical protein